MRRKVYADSYERKRDQRIGAIAFVVVNVIIYLAYRWLMRPTYEGSSRIIHVQVPIAVQLMPWVVNGAVLVWAFLFRPQLGVGYITSFGAILVACMGLLAIFVASCVVLIPLAIILPQAAGRDGGATLAGIIWIGLLLAGSIWFLVFGFRIASKWWSGE
jgi:hypothetical protein